MDAQKIKAMMNKKIFNKMNDRGAAQALRIFLNAMVHTKQYTVVFANGEMTVHFFVFLRL